MSGSDTEFPSPSKIRRLEPAQFKTSPDSTVIVFDATLLVKSLSLVPTEGIHSAMNSAVCEPAAVLSSLVQ